MTAQRQAPARLARALRRILQRLVARRPGRGEWAVAEVLSHLADAEIALAFRITALRRSNRRLGAAQKTEHGRHPEYGRLTIPQLLSHWAEHDLNHLEQIRAAHRRLSGRRSRRP